MGELTIEQMQQIVSGAPENSQVVIPCSDGVMYFAQREDGKWFRYSDGYQKWLEYFGKCDPMDLAIKLSDLKAQIDQHYYGRSEEEEIKAYAELRREKIEGSATLVGDFSGINELVECLRTPDLSEVRKEELIQDWKGMDGACAFSLIERHADNWKEIGYMMQMWLEANQQDLKAQLECCRKENAVLLGRVGELQERIDTTKSSQSKLHKTEMGDCLHFNTTMFHEGKATCFECDAVVNHKRKVIGVMQTRTLRGEHD